MPSVARFNVTPVKGLALQQPTEVRMEPFGIPSNRLFFLADPSGKRISSTRHPNLVQVHCSYDRDSETLRLRFPDGRTVEGDARAGDIQIVTDFWGRDVGARLVPGAWGEALSGFVGEEVRLARCDRDAAGVDVRALTLMSLASVQELARQTGADAAVDPRRFRMSIEIDGCEPHEEDTWQGKRVRIGGDAVVAIGATVPRCVITRRDPDTGEQDLDTLTVIRRYRGRSEDGGLPFGVYAEVDTPGAARVGDPVEVLD
jgi:uncharacterized protein YcbX